MKQIIRGQLRVEGWGSPTLHVPETQPHWTNEMSQCQDVHTKDIFLKNGCFCLLWPFIHTESAFHIPKWMFSENILLTKKLLIIVSFWLVSNLWISADDCGPHCSHQLQLDSELSLVAALFSRIYSFTSTAQLVWQCSLNYSMSSDKKQKFLYFCCNQKTAE